MQKLFFLGVTLMSGILLWSLIRCETIVSTEQEDQEPTISDRVSDGWSAYEQQDYAGALAQFEGVLEDEETHGESHAGSAWCHARLDLLVEAQQHVTSAIDNGYTEPDIYILDAALALAEQQHQTTLSILNNISDLESSWVFVHDAEVSYEDALLIQAHAHYHLGQFAEVTAVLITLDDGFLLDPDDPETWEFEGATYSAYPDALLAVLNSYSGLIT